METTARLKGLRMTPRKVRAVVDTVRGKPVGEALNILAYTRRAAAVPVAKLIKSAVSNADQAGMDVDTLYVKTITVDQGATMKRFQARAMGRAFRVEKKTSHVEVALAARS